MSTVIDTVEPIGMSEHQPKPCPKCQTQFTPKRKNQTYCSRDCQQNASRGSRKFEHKERSWLHYERANRLAEMIYSIPPHERLGMMRHILSFVETDAGLCNILTDPKLLTAPPKANNRMNIAKAASAYTRKFFGVSIQTYIKQVKAGTVNENHPVTR